MPSRLAAACVITATLAGAPALGGDTCPWDCDQPQNGFVDTADFLALLGTWGQVGVPCDFDGNGVDTADFLDVLGNWGPCPAGLPDECDDAIEVHRLSIDDDPVFLPMPLIDATASPEDSLCLGGGQNTHKDLWYCLFNDSGAAKQVKVRATVPNFQIEITEGCVCPPGAEIACTITVLSGVNITLAPGASVSVRAIDRFDLDPSGELVFENMPIPTGGCCVDGDCSIATPGDCSILGGVYNGDGTDCSEGCSPCSPNAIDENEPDCGLPTDTTNGGCEVAPPVFTDLACGDEVCGTVQSDGGITRDTDWFRVELDQAARIEWSVTPEFNAIIGVFEYAPGFWGTGVCADLTGTLNPVTNVTAGTTGSVTTECLATGTYYLFIAPQFGPVISCASIDNEYSATVTCETGCSGACCAGDGSCAFLPETICTFVGGFFQSEGLSCLDAACFVGCGNPISGPCCGFNGTPGCNDFDCCQGVCLIDPFCCDVSWDTACATQVAPLVPACGCQ